MKLLLLLLLLFACGSPSYWAVQHQETGDPAFDSSKLTYRARDTLRRIDLEFLKTADALSLYLLVHEHPLPKEVTVLMICNDEQTQYLAMRHKGGQRALASPALQEALLSALQEGKTVTLQCGGYKTTIQAEQFIDHFAKLKNKPLTLPFQFKLD